MSFFTLFFDLCTDSIFQLDDTSILSFRREPTAPLVEAQLVSHSVRTSPKSMWLVEMSGSTTQPVEYLYRQFLWPAAGYGVCVVL